jgi:Protein of unknown function (DUF3089)
VAAALAAVMALVAVGCGGGKGSQSSPSTSSVSKSAPPAPSATTGQTGGTTNSGTVWLCQPGHVPDPCTAPLTDTEVPAQGTRTVTDPQPDPDSTFDCFYVYPTVSTQPSDNANLKVQKAERDVAIAQASPFSQTCRVWAPMYRQRTSASLAKGLGADPGADTVAYDSLLSAWDDYLAYDNDGRPIIFIGHSQGAAMLIRLLSSQIDPNPALRARTVVAILAGGNVTVPIGRTVGATFTHIPLCTATAQTGCVIAYSSFPAQPPATSLFGRPGQGVSLQSGQTTTSGVQVACVNPASPGGGTADLQPEYPVSTFPPPPPPVHTAWVTYPDLYSATCRSANGATWLQVDTLSAGGRPVVTETLGPDWGYHPDDINLALGNLIADVAAAESAYTTGH